MVAAGIKVGYEGVNNVKARNMDIKWYHRLSLQNDQDLTKGVFE